MKLRCSTTYHNELEAIEINDPALTVEEMQKLLQETITWCKPRTIAQEPAKCLRSSELRPPSWIEDWSGDYPDFRNPELVMPLAEHRAAKTRQAKLVGCPMGSLEGGRLLVSALQWLLFEGAVQVECANYIGAWDVPPWDTWLWFGTDKGYGDYLLSWVPTEFVGLVDGALWAMSIPWLYWVDSTSPPVE